MKKNIYIHIGYPKTATTTLQNHYFKSTSDITYIGKYNNLESKYQIDNKVIQDLIFCNIESIITYNKQFSSDLYHSISTENIFLSEEALLGTILFFRKDLKSSNFIKTDPFELVKSIKLLFDENLFNIHILFTLRNQVDLIPSLYAQVFRVSYSKIQNLNTFEKFMKQYINNETFFVRKHLDYDYVITIFEKEFGLKNILVLTYEDFKVDKNTFFKRLGDFLHMVIDYNEIENVIDNKRSTADGEKIYDKATLFTFLSEIKQRYITKKSFGINGFIKKIIDFELPFSKKPGQIVLNEHQKNQIKEIYQKSNSSLSKRYNLELEKLGY